MGAKKSEPSQAVVVSSSKHLSKRKKLGLLLVLLVIAGAAVCAYMFTMNDNDGADVNQTPQEKRVTTLTEVQKLNTDKNYNEAAKKLQAYIDSNPPTAIAEEEVLRLAVAYASAKDFDKAIETYQFAIEKYPNSKYGALRGLGFAYMRKGDINHDKESYKKAIPYFEQAIEMARTDPEKTHVINSDETNIRYLKEHL